ncbi:MAG TPA: ATP-binding protein [Xanthobacteraceae bacterium]|nr:ATP-binding protein [Xanthobacteraceae bacterium]
MGAPTLIRPEPNLAPTSLTAPSNSPALAAVTAVLAVCIFILDTLTDLEIAADVLYVAIVLMSASFSQRRGIIIVSAGCVALTLFSYVLTYFLTRAEPTGAGLINDGIGLAAILATTYLVLRLKSSEMAMQAARTKVAQIARLTTLGEMTASIAHEINQPLAAIVTNGNACLRWLGHKPPNLGEARQAVERIVDNGDRASNFIERIRGLARGSPTRKDRLDINKPIREIISLTRTEVQQHQILLRTQLSDDLPPVLGDQIQLQQVMLNLILNAIEALASTFDGAREIFISSAKNELGNVLVTVRDSGSGLGAGALDRVFDPFYTTKPNGMGMGLAISRSVVEAHDGQIWAVPNTPHGAIVQFTLPAVQEKRPAPRSSNGRRKRARVS